MASIPMDLVEIRRTVYGKAMREPIADALLHLKTKYSNVICKRLDDVYTELDDSIIDWIELQPIHIFVNYEAESESATGLVITSQDQTDDYLLTDNRQDDTATEILGTEDDYRLNLDSSSWSHSEIDEESYYDYIDIPHYETYWLVFEF